MPRTRPVLAGSLIAVLALVLGSSLLLPAGARAIGPLPACRYDDLLTSPRGYGDWQMTLVDTILNVTRSYVPPDLVSVSEAGLSGDATVRAIVIDDLRAMRIAAAAAGAPFAIESAYRSYADQQQVFDTLVQQYGYAAALMTTARPGHSEHQLGVALDFRGPQAGTTSGTNFAASAAGKWMASHAWEYGFVMSYPKGLQSVTCYGSEPWHFRYVGRVLANEIHASGLTLREYLWTNFTETVVPPSKTSTGPPIAPQPTPDPTPESSTPPASPQAEPSETPGPSLPLATPVPSDTPLIDSQVPVASPDSGAIDPAVAAGAAPAVVVVAAITFALIIGGAWLASRRRRPGAA